MEAQNLALIAVVKALAIRSPGMPEAFLPVIRKSADFLMAHPLTDAQIAEASRTLHTLTQPQPPATPPPQSK